MADILIIDDDGAVRATLRKVLERAGHDVREAEEGHAGGKAIETRLPDLVITDLIMPGKEGIETIVDLREEYPELKILAISGGGAIDPGGPLEDARLFGADRTMAKPFSMDELIRTVDELLVG